MRLPPESAHFSQQARYGQYVSRRLRRAKRVLLADDVAAATAKVISLGRALEDANGAVQEGLADRDATDDDMDDCAQTARAALAGRAADAMKNPPYTLIFPQGIGYYVAATLEQEVPRYGELKSRLEEYLPADDEIRKTAVAGIAAGLVAFPLAVTALEKARTEEALAATRLEAAIDEWERLLTKVYGLLVADLGKAAADRFFPKAAKAKKGKGEGEGGGK